MYLPMNVHDVHDLGLELTSEVAESLELVEPHIPLHSLRCRECPIVIPPLKRFLKKIILPGYFYSNSTNMPHIISA